jgi:catechol 2,3-dioxygenase-like lactoylglutathione lyase family enzyme
MGPGKITVVRLAHVHYFVPDLQKAASFLEDFGLVEVRRDEQRIWYRGFGAQPYVYIAEQSANGQRAFGGAAWVVRSARDMEIAASYPGAIELDLDAPGGGRLVIIKDPNGMAVGLVHGQQLRDTKDGAKPEERIDLRREDNPGYPLNTALEKPRRGKFQRFSLGPSPVHKLGHYGYVVPKSRYQQTVEWYTTCMNLKPTDAVYNPVTGEDETCFMHIDRGMEETDHHVGRCPVFVSGWENLTMRRASSSLRTPTRNQPGSTIQVSR